MDLPGEGESQRSPAGAEHICAGAQVMLGKAAYLAGAAAGALVLSESARASETTVYTYDALGRLVAVATSGGPNNGLNVATCYDGAGNRATYSAGTGGPPPPPCPPPPPPSPAPGSAATDPPTRGAAGV